MKTDYLFNKYYYSRPDFVGGTTAFHGILGTHIESGSSVLEIGAGPRNETTNYLATLGPVAGADISGEVHNNVALTEAHTFDGLHLPFPDNKFDVCVSNWVVEHVDDPSTHFREIGRVLKPGGVYCFRTPNRWHYFVLASWLLPFSVHLRIANLLRGLPRETRDPYPTYYRANTFAEIRRLGSAAGLAPVALHAVEAEPSYGRLHAILFYPMMLYERFVNSCSAFRIFRASILCTLQKPRTKNAT